MIKSDKIIILFDGVCNLCNKTVQFLIKRDKRDRFRFASWQSQVGQQLGEEYELDFSKVDSVIVIDKGKVYTYSCGFFQLSKYLGGAWPLLYPIIFVPKIIRDPFYKYVARNRYKWFGKTESCWIPTPELRAKFLDV